MIFTAVKRKKQPHFWFFRALKLKISSNIDECDVRVKTIQNLPRRKKPMEDAYFIFNIHSMKKAQVSKEGFARTFNRCEKVTRSILLSPREDVTSSLERQPQHSVSLSKTLPQTRDCYCGDILEFPCVPKYFFFARMNKICYRETKKDF